MHYARAGDPENEQRTKRVVVMPSTLSLCLTVNLPAKFNLKAPSTNVVLNYVNATCIFSLWTRLIRDVEEVLLYRVC